ncbi:uncharacterized protein TA14250 [Theileria annulata]|uniref:6-Cys domain-containing protein n=1 Tax=Theileria annulata TaxID=5874 RepID=Q4UEY5_THEAN|nr:uncharacterized protein TA14250 [Theileria annulata]CAI74354.1 hypothetical protein TA14250 [Theileria annulata]|eukprot:XP_952086.1 hypothetical protein TA14250 [Theileria annulata]
MQLLKSTLFIYFIIYSGSFCSAKFGLDFLARKMNSAVDLAMNYAIMNETLSFKEAADFTADGESFMSYTLEPGSAIKFYCGTSQTIDSRQILMYPQDLKTNSLAPMSKSGINHSIKRVVRNFDLFRSDSTLIYALAEFLGGGYMIQYPADSVIVSNNPDFSLNFACVYDPNAPYTDNEPDELNGGEEKKDLLYRWVEVKFKNVYPMSYGCGSKGYPLFSNLSPGYGLDFLSETFLQPGSNCEIEPKPGMVIGIYCAVGETFNDELCFRDASGNIFFDQNYKHSGGLHLHLYRVPDSGYDSDVNFLCECKGKNGETRAQVRVRKYSTMNCDLTKIFSNYKPGKKITLQACRRDLRPGESLKLTVPANFSKFNYMNASYSSLLEPIEVRFYAYRQKLDDYQVCFVTVLAHIYSTELLSYLSSYLSYPSVLAVRKVKLRDLIVGNGLDIEKSVVPGGVQYIFKYKKDSILILTSETVSFEYFWTLFYKNPRERDVISYLNMNEKVVAVVSIGLFPTDPYTYGCGTRNDIFRKELLDFRSELINNKPASICRVDGKNSPIGFYCPKPFLLEPRDCFKSVLVSTDEGEKSVDLVKVDKHARHFTTKNLVVLDTYSNGGHVGPAQNEGGANYEDDNEYVNASEIMCKCVDEEGNLVASITVQLDKPVEAEKEGAEEDGGIPEPQENSGVEEDTGIPETTIY